MTSRCFQFRGLDLISENRSDFPSSSCRDYRAASTGFGVRKTRPNFCCIRPRRSLGTLAYHRSAQRHWSVTRTPACAFAFLERNGPAPWQSGVDLNRHNHLEERFAEEAQRLREGAKLLPCGPAREQLLRKARQAETGSHMSEWLPPAWIATSRVRCAALETYCAGPCFVAGSDEDATLLFRHKGRGRTCPG